MSDDIEGELIESPEEHNRITPRWPANPIGETQVWLQRHWRAVAIGAAVIIGVLVLVQLELLGTAMTLLLWGWYALLGGSVALGIAQWASKTESRSQTRQFVREFWRELILAGCLGLVIGEVARADDLVATTFIGGFSGLLLLPAVGWVEERTSFGPWFRSRAPRSFLIAALVLLLLGPQFRRELATDMCDEPNYWVETDAEESDSGQVSYTYSCYSPETDDYVAPRVEGRSLFGLRMSNIALRLYSLNFTEGHYEGIGICVADEDCFP